MREALKRLVVDESATGITKTTLKGLIARDLLTDDGQLTESGYQSAIALLPLTKQCELLDLPLIQGRCESPMGPEIAVLMALDDVGVQCATFDEGMSLLAGLHAVLRPRIAHYPLIRDEMFVFASLEVVRKEMGTETYRNNLRLWLKRKSLDHAEIAQSARNIMVLETSKKKASVRMAEAIANDIKTHADELADFLEQPYNARSGWPDIALLNNDNLLFVEVKSKDKLISSQIYNILALPKFLSERLIIVKVSGAASGQDLHESISQFFKRGKSI